jgi:hypothetical protein
MSILPPHVENGVDVSSLEGTNNGMFMIASEYQQLNGYIENNSSET